MKEVDLEDDAEVIEPDASKTDEGGSETPEAKADKGDEKPAVRDTLDFVRERRQEMRGTEKPATAKQTEKPAASQKDDEGDKEKPAAKADDKDEATRDYTAEELVGKDLRNVDLKRVPEVLRETVKKLQGSHDRAVKDEQRAKAAYEAKIAELQSAKPAQKDDDEDEEQFPILTELKEALATPKGRALIKDVLEKEGLSFTDARESSQQKIIATAVSSATEKYADLKDEKFFDEVITVIEEDDDLTATFRENLGNARGLSSVFKAAAAQVKASRGTAEQKKIESDKERIKREKEKDNAKPGSQAARATKKSGEEKPSTTLDFIKNRRAQLRGT